MNRPLNLKLLMPEEICWEKESVFQTIVFPDDSAPDSAAMKALAYVRDYTSDWLDTPDKDPKFAAYIVNEVEEVIKTLQTWVSVYRQVVVYPDEVEKAKATLLMLAPTERQEAAKLWATIHSFSEKIKLSPQDFKSIRETEVFKDESAMEQLARETQE